MGKQQTTKPLTKLQMETLRALAEGPVEGTCTRYVWAFLKDHKNVARAIDALVERSLAHVSYYRNGASANITDIGRSFLNRSALS